MEALSKVYMAHEQHNTLKTNIDFIIIRQSTEKTGHKYEQANKSDLAFLDNNHTVYRKLITCYFLCVMNDCNYHLISACLSSLSHLNLFFDLGNGEIL